MKGLTRKKLELLLERVKSHPSPKIKLEQYTIPSSLAATILWIAGFQHNDIQGRIVCDLGCGTGRLAIGAALMGAYRVVGIDIDREALEIAKKCSVELGVNEKICWILTDIQNLSMKKIDVVIQNPPFGVHPHLRGIDVIFLTKAISIAKEVVYSLHKAGEKNREFLERLIKERGGKVSERINLKFDITPTYKFHAKRHYVVDVDLYRIEIKR